MPYRKPQCRPEPVFHKPPRPSDITNIKTASVKTATCKELLYSLTRSDTFCDNDGESSVPPWNPFHASFESRAQKSVSNVAFNPIIMAPSSDYSTIYTTLKRTKECVNALGQSEVPVYFDMGLLTKALEITWAKPMELQGVIPCEGGMHLLMCVFATIGYLYGDAGLRELLFESDVFAQGSVQQILTGKDFERALRGFKLVDEALNNRFLVQFKRWCETNGKVIPEESYQVIGRFNEIFTSQTREADMQNKDMFSGMNEKGIKDLQDLLEEFEREGRSISPTFQFWHDFLKHVMLPMKLFIASSRLGV